MKRRLMLFGIACLFFCLTACGETTTATTTTTQGTTSSTTNGGNTTTQSVAENKINLRGEDFIIISNAPETGDPRKEAYTGINKEEKIAAIDYVQEKYNCNVVYKGYASNATWGTARDNWIIENSIAGTPAGHVFEISTSSVAILADNNAILPLDDYIAKFNMDDKYLKECRDYGSFLGQTYTYTDRIPFNDNIIFYNYDLLKELGYSDDEMPANLWNKGEWNWTKFKQMVKDLNGKFADSDKVALTGRTYNYAMQLINANGGVMLSSDLEVGINSPESIEAIEYVAELYHIGDNDWKDDAPFEDTCDVHFKNGKSVFQDGQTWYALNGSKLLNVDFDLDIVPFPYNDKNGTVDYEEAMEYYANITVWGAATYVISSGYDISKIPAGYEDMFLHGELIFQIWNDLQYFSDLEDCKYSYIATNYEPAYAHEASVTAHESIMDAKHHRLDLLYSLGEVANHYAEGITAGIENGVKAGKSEIRAKTTELEARMKASVDELFGTQE